MYTETRCQPVQDQWPPNQPYIIVNVALIHHEGEQTQQELIDMSMRNVSTVERLSTYHLRVTKRITDIFRSTQKRILIEGAPGIGKTVLAKEIAYCWANGEILTDMKLFLLVIRDPSLHCVSSIAELVHYLNDDYLSDNEVEVAVDELRKSKGSGIVLVIDGYDECPGDSKLKGFVDKLFQKKYLPMCMVVITSRPVPTGSLSLRQLVNQRIEILGLVKKERDQYISESLEGSPEIIIKLKEYLKQQPIINSLIYVPLHLAVLLYLFKQNSLPETLTEMNEYFIMHTIYRHLRKQRQLSYIKIDKLINLPEPELTIVYQFSKLAYDGLCDSKLVFTYDEMKKVCPGVDDIPGAISGFGLLQTVECYHHRAAGKSISLNFLHFTMQEYLAALHVSILPSEQQKSLMENTFWHRKFNFMWIMFVGIVGLPAATLIDSLYQPYLVHYQGQSVFAKKKLFLFQCYLELKEIDIIPEVVTSIFNDGNIDLSGQALLPHHIMSLTVFMMRSTTQWKYLNLNSCFIGCNGMNILKNLFINFQEKIMTIEHIGLRHNNLTSLWTTLTDIAQDDTDETMLSSGLLNSVESFDLSCNQLSDSGIIELFSVLMHYQKPAGSIKLTEDIKVNIALRDLDISQNIISDDGAVVISEYLMMNGTLCMLSISRNKITDEGAKRLAEAIQVNTTLQELNISKNWISKEGVMRIVEACTINRTLHKLVCTHNNLTKSGLAVINEYIWKQSAVQVFVASWNIIGNIDDRLGIQTTMQLLDVQVQTDDYTVGKDFWFIDEIDELKYRKEFLNGCLDVEHLNLAHTKMTDFQMIIFSECLMINTSLKELDLSNNKISDEGVKNSAEEVIQVSPTLPKASKSQHRISDSRISAISGCLKVNSTLCKLNLSSNRITNKGAQKLAEAIQVNTTLQELNISKNWISKEGVMRIVEACTINRTLHRLVCTHNNLSKSGLAVISEYIRKENAVHIFDASWNAIGYKDSRLAIKTVFQLQTLLQSDNIKELWQELWFTDEISNQKYIKEFLICSFEEYLNKEHVNLAYAMMTDFQMIIFSDCLMINNTVKELNLSYNKYTDESAKIIAEVIQVNSTLHRIDLSHNEISDSGVLAISSCLKFNSTLHKFNLSCNKITDRGAKRLAEAIQVNTTLQELNISKNWISKEGVMRIVEACTVNRTLHKLVCTHNNLSKSGLAVINEYIRKANAVQIFDASWNSLGSKHRRLAIKTIFQLLDINRKLKSDDNIQEELWYVHQIAEPIYVREFLKGCLENDFCIGSINIQDTEVTEFEFKILSDCFNVNNYLNELNLSNCLHQVPVFTILLNPNITICKLSLSNNQITDEETKEFVNFVNVNTIQSLDISNNMISDRGVSSISDCFKVNGVLCKLNLSSNKITDEGVMRLAEAIQLITTLQELNISKNWISTEGVMRIVEACTINRTLHKLVCTHNNLSKSGLAVINEYIRKENAIQIFDASWNNVIVSGKHGSQLVVPIFQSLRWTPDGWENKSLDYVKKVWLVNDGVTVWYDKVRYTFTHSSLTELSFQSHYMTFNARVDIIQGVMQMTTTLQKLNISHNGLSDDIIITFSDSLKTNTTLIELDMSCNNITCKGASAIAEAIQVNTALQKLNISRNQSSDDGAIAFNMSLKTNFILKELDISYNNIRSGARKILEAIQANTALQRLNISCNRICDKDIDVGICLQTNTALVELDMSNNYITCVGAIVEAMQINKTLRRLNISHNKLSDDGAMAFSECLRTNTTLLEFDMQNINITWKGTNTIAEALKVNNALQKLSISHNNITEYGAIAFSEYLKTNTTLIELDISFNYIACKGVSSIAEAVRGNKTLLKLNISHNLILDDGAIAFSECLKTNTTLIELNISYNGITCKGASAIAEVLKVNSALQKLNISNKISDYGAIAFSECLKTNSTLIELDLSRNNITCKGASSFAEAIRENKTLLKLNISRNKIRDDGMIAFSKCLKTNTTLIELDVSWNFITYGAWAISGTSNTLQILKDGSSLPAEALYNSEPNILIESEEKMQLPKEEMQLGST